MRTQMRTAVVTGASSGMGKEFVRQLGYFYKDLDEIWVIARRKERLEALKKESLVPVRIFEGDLLKKPVYKEYHRALKELCPDVRMLVNAAGFGKSGSFTDIAREGKKFQTDMVDLNCRALTRMTQMTIPWMGRGSRIVNLASAAAFCPQKDFAVYAATKAYVLSFSRALGSELNETAMLAINRNDMRVVLYHTTPNRSVVASTDMERSAYAACAGRVIMAHYSPKHLEKCLIRLGLPTQKEWPEIYQSDNPEQHLVNTLAAIKLRGYDIQYDHEVTGFASPLFIKGHVIGSLGTYLPNSRLTDKETIIKAMLHHASEINRKLEKFSQI